jgi:hypothetical protein
MGAVVELPGGLWWKDAGPIGEAEVRPLTGDDEEWLAGCPPHLSAVTVAARLVERCTVCFGAGAGPPVPAVAGLLPADRDFLVLAIRRLTYGPQFDLVLACPACGEQLDVGFDAGEVSLQRRPQRRRRYRVRVQAADGARRWVGFRLPTTADQEAVAGCDDPAGELLSRCVHAVDGRPAGDHVADLLGPRAAAEVETRMERLAPSVALAMDLVCAGCGAGFSADHELAPFLLEEMRSAARFVVREVHLIASHYHWSERDILGLERSRRRAYLHLIADQARRERA